MVAKRYSYAGLRGWAVLLAESFFGYEAGGLSLWVDANDVTRRFGEADGALALVPIVSAWRCLPSLAAGLPIINI